MPFCPECRDEFEDWVTICPDCKVALVPELEDDIPSVFLSASLVRVATAPNEAVAGMWDGILESNGIPSVLKGANFRAAQYSMPQNQFVTIHVLEPMSEMAARLLRPLDEAACNHPGPNLLPWDMRIGYVIFSLLTALGR
jgi:hypothetical protein